MTPQEKAIELFEKHKKYAKKHIYADMGINGPEEELNIACKTRALIEAYETREKFHKRGREYPYWTKVINEIDKIK